MLTEEILLLLVAISVLVALGSLVSNIVGNAIETISGFKVNATNTLNNLLNDVSKFLLGR